MFKSIDIQVLPTSFKAIVDVHNSNHLIVNCTSNEVLALKAGMMAAIPLYDFDILLLDICKFMIVAHEKWTPENDTIDY